MRTHSEPIFNVPAVVSATIAFLVLVHVVNEWILSPLDREQVLRLFAFTPLRYEPSISALITFPGGVAADAWTFITYAFLHGGWAHLGLNVVWLLAFGTPVARRFGASRFLAFFAVTAAGGAFAHLLVHAGMPVWMIGASAAISGFMAASIRFAFQRGGPLRLIGNNHDDAYRVPALPLRAVLRNPQVLIFLGVWFGLNLLFGLAPFGVDGSDQEIAWQAHIGGFLAGLLAFPLFDPVKRVRYGDRGGPEEKRAIH